MKNFQKTILFALIAIIFIPTGNLDAQGKDPNFEISGWIPYWKSEEGVESILPHLGSFTEVNPFVFTVKKDGSLFEASPLSNNEWQTLKKKAKQINVRFIPTITWGGSSSIHDVLSNPEKRQNHIRGIAAEVYKHDLDGIDIDYEGKLAETKVFFSLFLKELQEAIGHDKWIMCTIEARTPLDSRFSSQEDIPSDIAYANDFVEINKYCDRVRIMAYDQGRFDLKLNELRGDPYAPVADRAWVEKVMNLTLREISRDKITIGVATYGYEYDMFSTSNVPGFTQYSRLWSFNPSYALSHAKKLRLVPERNSAGELQLIYPASKSPDPVIPLPEATRIMTWSDAEAIRDKAKLTETLGLRGISIFKIDGGQDPKLWKVLEDYKGVNNLSKPISTVEKNPPLISVPIPAPTPAVVSTKIPQSNLEFGSRGEDVKILQQFLNSKGFKVAETGPGSPGNETVIFGSATRAALTRFQFAKGIKPATGYFGPITRKVAGSL